MLQAGIATKDLDVRWVSSISWYFLNLFGLQSIFIFLLGNDNGKPADIPTPDSVVTNMLSSCFANGSANGPDGTRFDACIRTRPGPGQNVPNGSGEFGGVGALVHIRWR
jgi:hypothetical protein